MGGQIIDLGKLLNDTAWALIAFKRFELKIVLNNGLQKKQLPRLITAFKKVDNRSS